MSKTISFSGWVSQIPNAMFNKWVKNGWITKETTHIGCADKNETQGTKYRLSKDGDWKWVPSKSMVRRLTHEGWTDDEYTIQLVKEELYEKMRNETKKWYNSVFAYVKKWLNDNNFIHLKSGSFDGGFCVESNPNLEHIKNWGAPLADEGNKVIQIKEKFGRIVVYFSSTTPEETKKIEEFEKHVSKKFDCCADFL